MILLICMLILLAALYLFLIAPRMTAKPDMSALHGVHYAHRGLHDNQSDAPENSMAAFARAADAGYGIELDVQLSRDGQVVVFHDDTLDRVCGVSGRVDEWDYEQLRTLPLCGTEEHIPLFSQVLELVDGRSTLIVELKPGKRNRELCRKTYALLSRYRGNVCIESFHPMIVAWFRFHGRDLIRGQLTMPGKDYEKQKGLLRLALAHNLFNPLTRPHFLACRVGHRPLSIRLSQLLGAMKICWTSHEPANEKGMDGVIFEFYRPRPRFK